VPNFFAAQHFTSLQRATKMRKVLARVLHVKQTALTVSLYFQGITTITQRDFYSELHKIELQTQTTGELTTWNIR
jgi:hypothetical protein